MNDMFYDIISKDKLEPEYMLIAAVVKQARRDAYTAYKHNRLYELLRIQNDITHNSLFPSYIRQTFAAECRGWVDEINNKNKFEWE